MIGAAITRKTRCHAARLQVRSRHDGNRLREVMMSNASLQDGSSAYLESLMKAGQQATKAFDDALAASIGVHGDPAKGGAKSPFAVAMGMQQQFWSPVTDFWRGYFNDKARARRPALQGRCLAALALLRSAQAILSVELEAIVRFRRSGAGRRQDRSCSSFLCPAVHRRDEPVEFPCDQSGGHSHRDPDPLGEPGGRDAKPDRGSSEGAHHAGR